MSEDSLFSRIIRKLIGFLPSLIFPKKGSWRWMRFYPGIKPSQAIFDQQNKSPWNEYQTWINKYALSFNEWHTLKGKARHWKKPPKISIITPVHNTDVHVLYDCAFSVRAQAYPYWEWILIDDASSSTATKNFLRSGVCNDPRIRVIFSAEPLGIANASNKGIYAANGDYLLFLDHDDRLALEALFYIAKEIDELSAPDIVYADRDMISPEGKRYMHLFKPDWSPETLLSGNYVFHPMCYRLEFVKQLGGLRSNYDGSQDYDLVLRAVEHNPVVKHIHQVLYHWRQHEASVALNSASKDYAFSAGLKALDDTLKRRDIAGEALEIESLWRGNYALKLSLPKDQDIGLVKVPVDLPVNEYAEFVSSAINKFHEIPYVAILKDSIQPVEEDIIRCLASWLKLSNVALVTGKIADAEKKLRYAGMAYKRDGSFLLPYLDFPETEPGYMAVTQLARNISAPNPYCVVIKTDTWLALEGFKFPYIGPHALLDFALRALQNNQRSVYQPFARFVSDDRSIFSHFPDQDFQLFCKTWRSWLMQGDPYYNSNLNENSPDMGINI